MSQPLVAPLEPPYSAEIEATLKKWMPPGAPYEPLALFRTLARSPDLMAAMLPLGAHFLGKAGPLPLRLRELLILRTCVNSQCNYEWGVHVTGFAAQAGLSENDLNALQAHDPETGHWSAQDQAALALCDELCKTQSVGETVKQQAAALFDQDRLLAIIVLVGWYQIIAKVANSCCPDGEPWAACFSGRG